eukprot:TRINITY_DN15354_c0_g1_i2.p1 TRINITY_DN15354_c0_g1~~TRINITY_DN15354_c0_g1_i2.p1  ORF type:complete len:251 (+),score=53.85 TRINITY_DN15354_c0_g1_i2:22-774(+)
MALHEAPNSGMFTGLCFYFEGYSAGLSTYHLKALVRANGGAVARFFRKRAVTHVVCTRLSASKQRKLAGTLLVTPAWVLDSLHAGARLLCDAYEPDARAEERTDDPNIGVGARADRAPPPAHEPLFEPVTPAGSVWAPPTACEERSRRFFCGAAAAPATPAASQDLTAVLATRFARSSALERRTRAFYHQRADEAPAVASDSAVMALDTGQAIVTAAQRRERERGRNSHSVRARNHTEGQPSATGHTFAL